MDIAGTADPSGRFSQDGGQTAGIAPQGKRTLDNRGRGLAVVSEQSNLDVRPANVPPED